MGVSHGSLFLIRKDPNMMPIEKGVIDGKPVDVITFDQFAKQPTMYPAGYTAINGDNGIIYPIRSKTDTRAGFYPSNGICKYKDPSEEELPSYSATNIIDFSNPTGVGDLINKQQALKQQERTILTTADNIFKPQVKPNDEPAMIALKTAVSMKDCDLDSYEYRFGNNYNNDRRLFEKPNISLNKAVSICEALDIKATLILQDAGPDIPNPMGDIVTIELTSRGGTEDA